MTHSDVPLSGARVLVTGHRRAQELSGALSRRGAHVVHTPYFGMDLQVDHADLARQTRELLRDPAEVVVVATAVGFRNWLESSDAEGLADDLLRTLAATRLLPRGPKARGAMLAAGLQVRPGDDQLDTSAAIAEKLMTQGVAGMRVAVLHDGAGVGSIDEVLAAAGATLVPFDVYRWCPAPDPIAVVDSTLRLTHGDFDAVLFTSAPAARAWWAEVERLQGADAVRDLAAHGALRVLAVGPVTALPLREAGLEVVLPERARVGALVRRAIDDLRADSGRISTPAGDLHFRATAAILDDRLLALTPSGLAVLRRLARTPGQVVSREELLAVLPGSSNDPHAAEVAVARLRRTAGAERLVRTVVKRGYRLQLRDHEAST